MIKTAETYHVPVLLKQSIDGLDIKSGGIYIDVTFGGGGHSREILKRINGNGHLYSFDQDEDAEKKEEEMTAQVVMAESTAKVLENEQIEIQEVDTVQEVVEKVNKSKRVRAKKEKNGNVRVKQVLQD